MRGGGGLETGSWSESGGTFLLLVFEEDLKESLAGLGETFSI